MTQKHTATVGTGKANRNGYIRIVTNTTKGVVRPAGRRLSGLVLLTAVAALSAAPVGVWAKVVYVSTAGNDANNGLTWATAKLTVSSGLTAAISGDQVWVASGTFVGCITLKSGVGLYGGFAGTETALVQRDWKTNITILDGNAVSSVVTSPSGATAAIRIDGFTIRNGKGTLGGGNYYGGGIYCSDSSPTIVNNTITANSSTNGGGIYCASRSAPLIQNNTITSNTVSGAGAGIALNYSAPTIVNNVFMNNVASGNAGGIFCNNTSSPAIANNVFMNNTAAIGGGVYCNSSSPTIVNNTFANNTATIGGGIGLYNSSPTIVNTIIAFNSSGLYKSGFSLLKVRYNCVYGNTSYNYSGLTDPTGTNGNISADPLLADVANQNWHLLPGSPCIEAADNSAVQSDVDLDDQPRIQPSGGTVDIGADEFASGGLLQVNTPVFVPDGGVYSADQSVLITCSTQGAVIHYTVNGADPTEGDPVIASGESVMIHMVPPITLKAKAFKPTWTPSNIKSAVYSPLLPATPFFSPVGGHYTSDQLVTITCATPDVVIHYTTNDLDPTEDDPIIASGGTILVSVKPFTPLKARAFQPNWTCSNVGIATYGAARLYVKPDGDNANGGHTWATAKKTISAGIGAAFQGDEVWVAAGTYSGGASSLRQALYGGFTGNETDLAQRNWKTHITIVEGGGIGVAEDAHSDTRIDGFTIRGSKGGGIECYFLSSPTIINNIITGNGAGIYCADSACPLIMNNVITGNTESIYLDGDGIYCYYASPIIVNNIIAGNTASDGGGIHCVGDSSPTIVNNTITGNSPHGIFCDSTAHPTITNTIIAFNSLGVYSLHPLTFRYNCLNGNERYNVFGFPDPTGTNGNITADPRFVRRANAGEDGVWGTADDDYGDLQLRFGSACIDAGSNTDVPASVLTDLTGNPRFVNDPIWPDTGSGTAPIVDMGAYEGSLPPVHADLNTDGQVDAVDFDTFSACYNGPVNTVYDNCLRADFNGDQHVDDVDFDTFSACYNGPVNAPRCP